MPIQDYSTDPDLNVQISGINIAEGCAPSGINNAIRQLMADVKEESEAQAEAITAAGEALEAFAETQAAKDAEQDEAIAEAKSSAEAAGEDVTALDTALRQLIAEELAKYLPLTGGNITGPLKSAAGTYAITSAVTSSLIRILGGTSPSTGANLDLYGEGDNDGMFVLRARTSASYKILEGRINGQLTWDGKPVLTLVASWSSGANWYRKWSDGWIEQGGAHTKNLSNNASYNVTFPIAFTAIPRTALVTNGGWYDSEYSCQIGVTACTATTLTYRISGANRSLEKTYWYACGL